MKVNITVTHNPPLPLQLLRKVAIIRHLPRDNSDMGLIISPDTIPMQDRPQGMNKGAAIPIYPAWWDYIRAINDDRGYEWARSVDWMWINTEYENNTHPMAESIHCGGNYVTWDEETSSHIRLVSYHYQDKPMQFLNPQVDNWFYNPHMFWKPCAIDKHGTIYRMGNGIDAYIPLIARTELWLPKVMVEFFPVLPEGVFYELRGLDVYRNDNGQLSPLMTTARNRVRTFYTDWRIETLGTVPVGS